MIPAEAVEQNVCDFLLALGRAGGAEERDEPGIQWTVGGSPIDYHNCVVRADLTPDATDAAIRGFCAALDQHGVPGTWHIGPSTRPDDLGARLLAQGFTPGGEEVGMALDLATLPDTHPTPAGMTVERVAQQTQLDAFEAVLASGFGEGEREARWVCEMYARIGLGDETAWRHYLGRLDGTTVAAASLFLTGDVGGLYFISTAPAWRKRGIGSAITYAALQGARQARCRWAVLSASRAGLPIYQRLGMAEVCRFDLYEWPPQPSDG